MTHCERVIGFIMSAPQLKSTFLSSDALDALSYFCTIRQLSVHSLELAAHNIVAKLYDSLSLEVKLIDKNHAQMILQYPDFTEDYMMSRKNGCWEALHS